MWEIKKLCMLVNDFSCTIPHKTGISIILDDGSAYLTLHKKNKFTPTHTHTHNRLQASRFHDVN